MSFANGQGIGACFSWIPGFPVHFHSLPVGGDDSPKSVIPQALNLERMGNDAFTFLTTWREWDQQLNPSSQGEKREREHINRNKHPTNHLENIPIGNKKDRMSMHSNEPSCPLTGIS